ncbi:MAG: redoxin domain-containing protein, partial [bacterium]|nr:redoxin domain-containing protein [bacterium]
MRVLWMLGLLGGLGALSWNAMPANDTQESDKVVTLKHRVITEAPRSGAINRRVSDLEFTDLQGRTYRLSQLTQRAPVVFVFTATKCPAAQRYTVRVNQMYETYRKRGVQLFLVYPNYDDTREAVEQHRREYGLKPPAVHDPDGAIARALGATMTPQAVLIDKKMLLRYRGAIDDNRYETRVREHYLKNALEAVLAGKPVKVAAAETFGCTIRFREEAAAEAPITYAKHIAPILQEYCQPCHRPGEVAPFSLLTYRDAYTWRREIAKTVQARQMPPWKPTNGHGVFQGERRLTDEQIGMIVKWAETGAPMGDPNDMPPPRQFSNDWALGKPDIIAEMPVEYEVGPTGDDEYRHFVIPTNFDEDVFVRAIDIQPGNRNTVHHVIVFLDTSGTARRLDAADPKPGYEAFGWPGFVPAGMLGGWAPGFSPSVLPQSTGYRLPKGADIVLQIHYYRTGKPEKDRTRVGLYLEKQPNPKPVGIAWLINPLFRIPAGAERHEVWAMWIAPRDVEVVAITPHMHLLGREMKVEAELPDGSKQTLIHIDDWDFKWQDTYHYKTPVKLPRGTRVVVRAYYDNSEKNPNNPHKPPIDVAWGERTSDEMC